MRFCVCKFWLKGSREIEVRYFSSVEAAKRFMEKVIAKPTYCEATGSIEVLAPYKDGELTMDDFIEY